MERKPSIQILKKNIPFVISGIAVSGKQLVMILVSATVAITICSKSSPIYPFNDWVDANCFLTVGKSMLHGLVPYRDLYEQKGPLLYMLHALAAMISDTTFIGVYFLEVIAASVFLFFSFKIMKLYQEPASVFLVPILAAVVYSGRSFCNGDSAEELCLPMFSFAIYLVIKMIRYGKLPTRLEFVALGVTSAFVFWIKFSLLGFYLGWFCVIVWWIARHRDIRRMIHTIICIAVGFLIPTVFILIYFGMNKAIADMWTVYFYNNLFFYSTSSNGIFIVSLALNLIAGIKNVIIASKIPALFIGIGLLALLKKSDKTEFFAYLIMCIFTFLLIYIGGRHSMYYSMIFNAFVPIGILVAYQTLNYYLFSRLKTANALRIFHRFKGGILCLLSLVYAFIQCDNTYLLNYDRSDLPQYEFAKIISHKKNATLLNYGFLDGGFYTTTGIIPNCRFFCNLNIELDEIMQTQNRFIKEGKVDFVVTRDAELESEQYKCVAFSTFYFEGADRKYFLYQREER